MGKMINCISAASTGIETSLKQLEEVEMTLEEKKGSNSIVLRNFLMIVYFVGLILCVIWALMYRNISLAPVNESFGFFITISAGASCALFFVILLLRKLLEAKYYRIIYKGLHKIERIRKHIYKVRNSCFYYNELLSKENSKFDHYIELGEDVSAFIGSTSNEINSLEKGKADSVNGFLIFMYYVAAFSVGAFILLFIQNNFRNMLYDIITNFVSEPETIDLWTRNVYIGCTIIAVFVGPIFSRFFFDKIKILQLRDSLIFLIAGSSILAFVALVIAVALIAGIVALVWVIIKAVLFVLIIGAIIGILAVVFSGG